MNDRSQLSVFDFAEPEETREKILAVLWNEPELNSYGYGKCWPDNDLAAMRADALTDASCQEFEKAAAWLQQMNHVASLNRDATSYNYKHEAERWFASTYQGNSYVANGMLIIAALHLGLNVRRIVHNGRPTPNAHINLPRKRPGTLTEYGR